MLLRLIASGSNNGPMAGRGLDRAGYPAFERV